MTSVPLDVDYKANPTRIMLVGGVIKPLGNRFYKLSRDLASLNLNYSSKTLGVFNKYTQRHQIRLSTGFG